MLTIKLTDPELIQYLESQAKAQNSTIEHIIKQALIKPEASVDEASVPSHQPVDASDHADDMLKRAMHKIYNMARRYWQSVGDVDRANITDEELAEKFGRFDENGIPRFKDELPDEPPVGSLAYAAKIIEETGGVIIDAPLNEPLDLTNMKETLAKEFGDYLYNRMNGEYDG